MSAVLPKALQELINHFQRLPGIGPKTAARLAYFYVNAPESMADELAATVKKIKNSLHTCSICFNTTEEDPCPVCADQQREESQLCVVEAPLDIIALEQAGVYKGKYFVLAALLSPVRGVGPEDIRLFELKSRINKLLEKNDRLEIILALNPSVEGESTSLYIKQMVEEITGAESRCQITRLAMGLPTGADIDYADEVTLQQAFVGRSQL